MRNIFTRFMVVSLLLLVTATVSAQPTSGKIYNIVNVGNSGYSLAAVSMTTNSIVATDATDYAQLWYVGEGTDDGTYTVRNLSNGFYLQTNWRFAKTPANLYCVAAGSDYTFSASSGPGGFDKMHYGANEGYVVNWEGAAAATQWIFNEVAIDNATLQANWNEIAALEDSVSRCDTYNNLLENIFSDESCTTFKSGYSYSETETNYLGLPYGLRRMVTKINAENWAEDNADADKKAGGLNWEDSYAKRFRVQMYEPYSIAGDITSWLKMNAHANNDNPTGVYVNGRGLVYVMVEGEIAEGATLRLIDAGHNNRIGDATTGGFELKTGLNVIPCYGKGGHLYICYNVDTYNASGTTAATRFPENRRLSNYKPLKIHIEGGAINGFYNACGDFRASAADGSDNLWKSITGYNVDCDEDWKYMEERANLNVLPILGHRQILLFQLNDWNGNPGMKTLLPETITVPTDGAYSRTGSWDEYNMRLNPTTGKINIMLEAWDRIMYSEHATLGLVSQSTMDKMNEMYPRWNSDGTTGDIYTYDEAGPDGKTYKEYCEVDYSEHFNHHGVGLGTESGYMSAGGQHCNYHINTFGNIVSLIASEAGSLWGPAHEIGHQHQNVFNIRGGTEVTNNVFSNAAVWYMGMATSRVNGAAGCLSNVLAEYNAGKPFIDYDIWAMTQLFYKLWLYYHLAGNNTQFYPRFFEMLRRDPLNAMGGTANGTESMLKIYEKMCEASGEDLTEFFRIHGFFVPLNNYPKDDYSITVFTQTQEEVDAAIGRVKAKNYKENLTVILINDGTSEASVKHDGKTKRALWDSVSAEFGAVGDYIDGEASITEIYDATVSVDGLVTISGGAGGVGFLVVNEDGKVLSFSNKSSFQLSEDAMYQLATGKASVVTIDAKNNTMDVNVDLSALQSNLLEKLIADVTALGIEDEDKIDDTLVKVGYWRSAAVVNLKNLLVQARTVLQSGTGYVAAYESLYTEYVNVKNNPNSRVTIVNGAKYAIKNVVAGDYMTINTSTNAVVTTNSSTQPTTDDNLWIIELNGATANIKHSGTNKYLQEVSNANSVNFTVGASAVNYVITEHPTDFGVFGFHTSKNPKRYMDRHSATQVATWEGFTNNAKWTITMVDEDTQNAQISLSALRDLIKKTEALITEVADVIPKDALALQAASADKPFYVSTNADQNTGGGNNDGGGIAALVDGNLTTYFHTRWGGSVVSEPHYIQVDLGEGRNIKDFQFFYTPRSGSPAPTAITVYGSNDGVTFTDVVATITSGLPAHNSGNSYESAEINSSTAYRYLRFTVTQSAGPANAQYGGYYFFGMKEFSIKNLVSSVIEVYDGFEENVTRESITNAANSLGDGKNALNTSNGIETATTNLSNAYEALYEQYQAAVAAKKVALKELAAETAELINSAGIVNLLNGELALQAASADKPFYVSTNADQNTGGGNTDGGGIAALVDGRIEGNDHYFHSRWGGEAVNAPHHIQIDLGDGNSINAFKFSYVAHNAPDPTTIVVSGSNDGTKFTPIETITKDVIAVSSTYTSKIFESATAYRYLRFAVTASSREGFGSSFGDYVCFGMKEFDLVAIKKITIKNNYPLVTEEQMIATALAKDAANTMAADDFAATMPSLVNMMNSLQAEKDKLNQQMVSVDKTALVEYLVTANNLYEEFSEDGAIAPYYATSSVTLEQITALKEAIDASNAVVANDAAIQTHVDEALATLKAKAQVLEGIKANDYSGSRENIGTEITNAATLLADVMSAAETLGDVPLQASDATAPYYIWSNRPANDSNGIEGGLIDKNDDGTAKTNTFFGTYWQSGSVEPYTDYLEVDLGSVKYINELLFNYTTRTSDHANQRPNGIKVLASNDKKIYKEVFSVTDGLPTGATEKWELEEPLNFVGRYIRFAVSTEVGYFNMADFNLIIAETYALKEFYTTSDIDASLIAALNVAVQQASAAKDCFVLEDDYNTALANLQNAYKALNAFKNAHVTDVNDLEELATTTDGLVTEVATFTEEEKEITMQCTDANEPYYLYCNAAGTGNDGSDALGVAALVGEKSTNTEHLHTAYKGSTDDFLDHYLRLDMGEKEAMVSFKFRYTGRVNNNNNAPEIMVIEGSNDLNNFEEIATLTDLPVDDATVTYTTPTALGNGKAYRYIRFMVIKTKNNAKYKERPYFVLSQFAVTACKTIKVSDDYVSPNLPLTTLVTANNEMVEANAIVPDTEHYLTQNAYDTANSELQAAYDALNAATVADKTALVELIEATEVLEKQLYKIDSYDKQEITLSATPGELGYIYCNAPENNVTAANDMLGVSALIDKTGDDPEYDTYLHTDYNDDDSEDGLDHYLRVDLGTDAAKAYVEFEYRGRSGAANLTPDIIVVEATNDLDSNDWTKITTLKGLAETTIQDVASGCLGNGVAYRYWRFMVTKTHNNNSKKESAGHPFFALSNFKLYECTNVERSEQLKYSPTIYIYTTTDLVTEVDGAINAAAEVKDNADATQSDVDAELEELKAVYDKLEEALKYADVPVAITTDINSPKLYVIYSQRGDTENNSVWTQTLAKCWQYNFANKNITINNYDSESLYHLWYFTYDDDDDCYGIVPVMTPAYPMGSNNIGNAANRVFSVSLDDADGYVTLWSLSKSATTAANDGVYYNFKPFGYNTYLSNIYGGTNALGFYGSEDEGSRVYFKSVEVEDLAFKRLSKLNEVMGTLGITPAASEIVGEYTMASATTYSEAVETATSMVEGDASTDAEYNEQFVALYQSYENLAINLPVPGTLYKLRSKYVQNHYFFVNDDRAARYSNSHVDQNQVDADAVWVFEGEENGSLKLKNLQTGCFLPSLQGTGAFNLAESTDAAGAITLHPFGTGTGAVQIQAGNYYLHSNDGSGADRKLIGWYSGGIDGGNPVFIEEISAADAEDLISHSVTLAANTTGNETIKKYSTLCLGYPVTLPAESDVKAYIASGIDDNNVIELVPVANDGKTIPANTPVILKSDSGVASVTATFTVDAVSSVDETTNLLGGSNYTTYVSCLNEQGENVANVYMLTRKNGLIAMRWMYENYKLENGAYTQVENTASDDGGYVKCPANKAYLKLDAATSNLSTEYYFGFFGGATDIDEVNTEENPLDGTIFDLQGRKIEEVTVPGFYIVNGEKMYVDTDMLK